MNDMCAWSFWFGVISLSVLLISVVGWWIMSGNPRYRVVRVISSGVLEQYHIEVRAWFVWKPMMIKGIYNFETEQDATQTLIEHLASKNYAVTDEEVVREFK